jgi:hypothetical protein
MSLAFFHLNSVFVSGDHGNPFVSLVRIRVTGPTLSNQSNPARDWVRMACHALPRIKKLVPPATSPVRGRGPACLRIEQAAARHHPGGSQTGWGITRIRARIPTQLLLTAPNADDVPFQRKKIRPRPLKTTQGGAAAIGMYESSQPPSCVHSTVIGNSLLIRKTPVAEFPRRMLRYRRYPEGIGRSHGPVR